LTGQSRLAEDRANNENVGSLQITRIQSEQLIAFDKRQKSSSLTPVEADQFVEYAREQPNRPTQFNDQNQSVIVNQD